ncbi:uncharacterized protein LOC143054960 [Mytilus galloprovincialis]|uniref:uncharacterized protein LOC143054960 n=1 Tax=Mytilus galloprovincialis TaxID=29158 RepID=UPI003F7C5FBB
MMKSAVLIWFIQVIDVTFVYELKCPAPGHWRLRARKFYCGQSYVCLLRSPENSYRETCDGLDYSSTENPCPFNHVIGTAVRNKSCQEIIVRTSQPKNLSSPLENRFKDVRNYYNEGRTYKLNCIYFTVALLIVLTIGLPIYGLSQWPDTFYKVPSFKWIVDHLTFFGMLKNEESKKIKKRSSNEEKNRKLMEILLNGGEDHYDKFLDALNAFGEYQELAKLIHNTEVKSEDKELIQNCTKRSN